MLDSGSKYIFTVGAADMDTHAKQAAQKAGGVKVRYNQTEQYLTKLKGIL